MTGLGSIRTKKAPKKTIKCYKLLRLVDGKIYPLFIGRGEALEFGVWYDADSPDFRHLEKLDFGNHLIDMGSGRVLESREKNPSLKEINEATANNQRWIIIKPAAKKSQFGNDKLYYNWGISKSKGKEVANSSYSLRPGWHSGELPVMNQIGIPDGNGGKLRDDSFVWVECEISADKNYQDEADANPNNDIPTHIPTDGYYEKCTNVNKVAAQAKDLSWYISGSIKFNRFISDDEAHRIIDKFNKKNGSHIVYDYPRVSGKKFNANTMSLEGVQPNLFNQHASVSGVCRNIHRPIRGIDSEELFMKMAAERAHDYEVDAEGKLFKKGEYSHIRYTKEDFFMIDFGHKDKKRVQECCMYYSERFGDELMMHNYKADNEGNIIYAVLMSAENLIYTYKQYKDEWIKSSFIYADSVKEWFIPRRFYMIDKFKRELSKMNHLTSLFSIKKYFEDELISDDYIEAVEDRIDALDKSGSIIKRLVDKYDKIYIKKTKAPQPTDKTVWECVSKDELRKNLCGCYHDESGYAVFSNARIMFVSKKLYNEKFKGKIVRENGYEIEGQYPNWKAVIPADSYLIKKKIDVDDLLIFLKKFEEKQSFRKIYGLTNMVYIDGIGYSSDLLINLLKVSKIETGAEFYFAKKNDSVCILYFRCPNGSCGLIMNMVHDGFDFRYGPFKKNYDYNSFIDNAVYWTDDKLRLAKARAKAIIIRQRQRARNNNVSGITYEMD